MSTVAHRLQHRLGRQRQVEHALAAAGGDRFLQRGMHDRHIEIARQEPGGFAVEVEHAGDRQARLPVGRQMRLADDPAAADDGDRARARRHRPRLPQPGQGVGYPVHDRRSGRMRNSPLISLAKTDIDIW
jgi:hypothetical protein